MTQLFLIFLTIIIIDLIGIFTIYKLIINPLKIERDVWLNWHIKDNKEIVELKKANKLLRSKGLYKPSKKKK